MFKVKINLVHSYFKYLIYAKHFSGHGIHSPFIFDFVTKVLFVKEKKYLYNELNSYRRGLSRNAQTLEIEDKGAGSNQFKSTKRRIKDIIKKSSSSPKYGKLLARIVAYYQPEISIELGTSLGIGTSYLAVNLQINSKLYTIEGDYSLYKISKLYFDHKFGNIVCPFYGGFDQILPELLNNIDKIDLIFFDGNHRKEPTIRYFELCLEKINNQTIFIFDDIHWSKEMEEAWEYIKSHPKTRVCIDLFQMGLVFFRKELSCENFIIRF